MPWRKSYVSSYEAHWALQRWFVSSKLGRALLIVAAILFVGASVSHVYEQDLQERSAEDAFFERCEADVAVTDCDAPMANNGEKCFRVAASAPDTEFGVDFEQYYACTLKSYEVWAPEYRARKGASR